MPHVHCDSGKQGYTKLKLCRDVYNFQGRVEIIGSQTGATPQCHLLPYLLPQTIQKPNHPFTSKSSFPVL